MSVSFSQITNGLVPFVSTEFVRFEAPSSFADTPRVLICGVSTDKRREIKEVFKKEDLPKELQELKGIFSVKSPVTQVIVSLDETITKALENMREQRFSCICGAFSDFIALHTEMSMRWNANFGTDGFAIIPLKGDIETQKGMMTNMKSDFFIVPDADLCEQNELEISCYWSLAIAESLALDPAMPLKTLTIKGFRPPTIEKRKTRSERETQLKLGMSTFRVFGADVQMERILVSSSKDTDVLDVNLNATLSYLRADWNNFVSIKYARAKLGDDGQPLPLGQIIVTPKLLKAELLGKINEWVQKGFIEQVDDVANQIVVERSKESKTRIDVYCHHDLMNQLFGVATKFAWRS